MPTTKDYHSYLIESLKDPQEAAAYLDAVLEECNYDEFLLALKNVAEARIMASDNLQTPLSEATVQRLLLSKTTLDLVVLLQTLNELGFKLSVTPIQDAA